MKLFVGTSGFSYKEWKGTFYPPNHPDRQMLAFYATRLPTVEINNTFYRMPKREALETWAGQVPESFTFALKAPQRITHRERLEGSDDSLRAFLEVAGALGGQLGPVLFQLPPFLRKDPPRLEGFLAKVPRTVRAAFEFRHPSWFADDVYDILRASGAALVGGDSDKAEKSPPLVATASFGYLRLRAEEYGRPALAAWAERIRAQGWTDAFVFLKHEIRGPEFAETLSGLFAEHT
ncbi:MAG TPA: DUF72 domain-containing protein [Polyangiaceae bacterium]|jgi:uncharacterized protein YecE (DUF72 family)|nr:DUF72 domain-containing protein [Polyangiaceae bacterium]